MTERDLIERFPEIPWLEPISVTAPGVASAVACRLCIALHGLNGRDVVRLPRDVAEWRDHFSRVHPGLLP